MLRFPLVRVAAVLVLTLSCTGCTSDKKKAETEGRAAAFLQSHSLLQTIPDNSIGFLIWDLDKDSFKQFRSSPWGDSASTLFSGLSGDIGANTSVDVISGSLQDPVFWRSLQDKTRAMAASTFFVGSDSLLGFFAALQARSAADLEALHGLIKAELESDLFSVTREGEVYSAIHSGKDLSLFYRLIDTRMYVASDKNLISGPLDTFTGKGISQLTSSPVFEKTVRKLPARGNEYALFYLQANDMLERMPQDIGTAVQVTKNMPLEGVAINRSMKDGPLDSVALTFSEDGPQNQLFFSRFSQTPNLSGIQALPAASAVAFGIDGGIVSGLLADIQGGVPAGTIDLYGIRPETIQSIISMGLGFEDVAPGSLFPSVVLSFVVAPDSSFATELRAAVATAMQTGTGVSMPWQQKSIEGSEVEYVLTPLGIGVYIASTPTNVFVSSSEQAMQKMLAARAAGRDYLDSLPESIKAITTEDTFAELVISFPAVATAIRNLSGSLAMFTGGQVLYEEKHLKALESFGLLATTVAYSERTLLVKNHYTAPATP